ncbi:Glutamyl-tRNA(Gln) amidotransferase subunit A [Marinibacterium anthonyi]|nr:amidase [Paracoccaceae bacterium]QEW18049.1 Glutamyl-tRNA(Gln) amidotransferase subunit A [Marinibacterium anthonyi]
MQDWLTTSAADLGRGIETGAIDPVALTETFLDAIDAHPHRDSIYARVTPDRARAEAEAARKRAQAGARLSPLDGVPVSWKDLVDTAGIATEAGTALLQGRIPTADALVLRNATAMGTVCLGKTHLSELAFSGLGYNPITGTPPNVNDPDAVPGGSSSGAAASVAFGLAPVAIGSDTGGSVRVPAAWNDLVGLKTTSGRLSLDGVVPLCLKFDTIGPLARTVEDAALAFAALEGRQAPDLKGVSLAGARIAVLTTVAQDDLRDAPAAAFESAKTRLEAAGAQLVPLEVPWLPQAMGLSPALFAPEGYGLWKDVIEAAPEKMYPQILERFRAGAGVSAPEYVAAWAALDRHRAAWAEATAAFDAVLIPSAPNLPPNLKRLIEDAEYYKTENLISLRNTRIGNLMGLSALTLPTGTPSCGIMLMGRPGGEDALLRLGVAAEAALGV